MKQLRLWLLIFVAAAGSFLLAACAGFKTSNQDEFNLITTARTPLFAQGPQQTTPPEAYLEAGTRIRMIHSANTHIQVETVHGLKGFVASSDIGPAP